MKNHLLHFFPYSCILWLPPKVWASIPQHLDSSAALDIAGVTKGFLMPRLNTAEMTAIPLPATGLAVFNTDSSMYAFIPVLPGGKLYWAQRPAITWAVMQLLKI